MGRNFYEYRFPAWSAIFRDDGRRLQVPERSSGSRRAENCFPRNTARLLQANFISRLEKLQRRTLTSRTSVVQGPQSGQSLRTGHVVFIRVEPAIQQQSSADIISKQILRVLFATLVSNLVVPVNHNIFTDGKISKHDMYIIVRLSFAHTTRLDLPPKCYTFGRHPRSC